MSNIFDQFDAPASGSNPFDQFDPAPEQPEQEYFMGEFGRRMSDLGASFGMGSGALFSAAGGLYGSVTGDYDNAASRIGQRTTEYWNNEISNKLAQKKAARAQAISESDGFLEEAGTAFWETLKDPELYAATLAEAAPSMTGPSAVARGVAGAVNFGAKRLGKELSEQAARRVGLGAVYTSTAGVVGGGVADQTYHELIQLPEEIWQSNDEYVELLQTMDPDSAKNEIATSKARQAGAIAATVSGGTMMLGGKYTPEAILSGAGKSKGLLSIPTSAGIEAVQEGVEGAAETMATNLSVGAVDQSRELTQGLGESVGIGVAAGGGLGGSTAALSLASQRLAKRKEVADAGGDALDQAGAAAAIDEALGDLADEATPQVVDVPEIAEPQTFGTDLIEPTLADLDQTTVERARIAGYSDDEIMGVAGPIVFEDGNTRRANDQIEQIIAAGERVDPREVDEQIARPVVEQAPDAEPPANEDLVRGIASKPWRSRKAAKDSDTFKNNANATVVETPEGFVIVKPFKTEKSAKASAVFRENEGSVVREVDGGFMVEVNPVAQAQAQDAESMPDVEDTTAQDYADYARYEGQGLRRPDVAGGYALPQLDAGAGVPNAPAVGEPAPESRPAETIEPGIVRRPNGRAFGSEEFARLEGQRLVSRGQVQPEQLEVVAEGSGFVLQVNPLPEPEAAVEAAPEPAAPAEPTQAPFTTGAMPVDNLPDQADADPAIGSTPEQQIRMRYGKKGKPWKRAADARRSKAAQQGGEVVEVEGGFAVQMPSAQYTETENLFRVNGQPFKTKTAAKASKQFKTNDGAEIVEIDGGFAVQIKKPTGEIGRPMATNAQQGEFAPAVAVAGDEFAYQPQRGPEPLPAVASPFPAPVETPPDAPLWR